MEGCSRLQLKLTGEVGESTFCEPGGGADSYIELEAREPGRISKGSAQPLLHIFIYFFKVKPHDNASLSPLTGCQLWTPEAPL